ncbi:MAG: DUF11 domain-containing protein [Methanobacterium sp.]
MDNSTNNGLANASIKVHLQNGTLVSETLTNDDGSYSVNFIDTNTVFIVIANKLGYVPIAKTITVTPSSDPGDPNLYGTANFRLYELPTYSGNASSYLLNVGALPSILLDIYAGRSSAWVNSTNSPYSNGGGTPLEVRLLSGSLLSGLLDVYSTGNEGYKYGGLDVSANATLDALLLSLGLDVGLLNATAYSSINPPESSGGSDVASLDLGIQLLISLLSLNVDAITADSSVIPNFNTGLLVSSSNSGAANITVTLLGFNLLEIEALQTNAIASVNGNPGGAIADFNWQVADIRAFGESILAQLTADGSVDIGIDFGLFYLHVLTLSLGADEETTTPDGTYARASGDALRLQILGLLGEGLVNLIIGHAEAEAQVPVGGLDVDTSDLSITKTVNNPNPNYLQNVTFTLTARNHGPDNATGVTVTDLLPAGLRFISADGNYNSTTGIWTIGNLATNATAVLNIIAQVIASNTQLTNTATINGTNYDQNTTNNQANTTVTVNAASDLGISKTVNNPNPNYLDNVTFTLTARNHGPDNATGVTVTDLLPAGLRFISADGNYNSTTGIWTIGNLATNATAVLNIIAQVIASNTQLTNTATINGTNYDQNTTNNQANTTVTVNAASDLGISKTVNNPNPNYLDNVTFTLTARNHGPDNATGVTVTDLLPAGLRFISADGNYNSTTGIWTIGNLATNATAVLNIIAQVIASNTQLTNTATINGTNYDQNTTNNQANTTVTVNAASDLGISKTVNNPNPNYLDNVTFTLTARNHGPDNATGVTVTDLLPAGLRFISADGNYNSTTGIWTIGNLATNATAVLNIIAQVIASNTQLTNTATINGTNYDQNTTNNQANTTVTVGPAPEPVTPVTPIKSAPVTPITHAAVPMQPTGVPIGGMLLAILLVLAGMILSKKN